MGKKPDQIGKTAAFQFVYKSGRNNQVRRARDFFGSARRLSQAVFLASTHAPTYAVLPRTRLLTKPLALLLIFSVAYLGLSSVGGTIAFFNDTEISRDNIFSATGLGFEMELKNSASFRTQSQGGWGSPPAGNNPGAYLARNFSLAWPAGISIGSSTGYSAYFTSSTDIRRFLPQGGEPGMLVESHNNPAQTEAGVLAGQVLALALNIGFDDYDPDFGTSLGRLADEYANGPDSHCYGLSAGEVLAQANDILAGLPGIFTPSQISDCATEINEKYVDGQEELLTPAEPVWRNIVVSKTGSLDFQYLLSIEPEAGSADLCQALVLDLYLNNIPAWQGPIADLDLIPQTFLADSDRWEIFFSLPENAPEALTEQSCGLKYLVEGWQIGFDSLGGFSQIQEIPDRIHSGKWKCQGDCAPEIDSETKVLGIFQELDGEIEPEGDAEAQTGADNVNIGEEDDGSSAGNNQIEAGEDEVPAYGNDEALVDEILNDQEKKENQESADSDQPENGTISGDNVLSDDGPVAVDGSSEAKDQEIQDGETGDSNSNNNDVDNEAETGSLDDQPDSQGESEPNNPETGFDIIIPDQSEDPSSDPDSNKASE